MEPKVDGRSSRKLHSVEHRNSTTLPGSPRCVNHNTSVISSPLLVNRWQFRTVKSVSPESNMSEKEDANGENFSLVGLVQEMLHSETGVPIRSHRYKLTAVPSVFTGQCSFNMHVYVTTRFTTFDPLRSRLTGFEAG